jgi:hypothetical protein
MLAFMRGAGRIEADAALSTCDVRMSGMTEFSISNSANAVLSRVAEPLR